MNRYLTAVAKQTPFQERMRIVKITRSLIEAKLAQDHRELPLEQKLIDVLLEVGPPSQVVNRFIAVPRYIIGPYAYDSYWLILKLVAITVFVSLSIATSIDVIFNGFPPGSQLLFSFLTNILSAIAQIFLWITIVFIVFERYGLQITLPHNWHPTKLPPASKLGDAIPPFEPIIGLLLTAVFFSLCYFSPQIIGIFDLTGDWRIISVFNLAAFPNFLPFFIILLASSSACHIAKLMSGQWNYPVLTIVIISNLINTITVGLIMFEPRLWNPTFISEFAILITAPISITVTWLLVQHVIFLGFVIFLIVDSLLQTIRVWQLHQAPTFLPLSELADN